MSIRCLAIDDEPMALDKLKNYIMKVPYLELAAACTCPSEAMAYLAENQVDAIFVDINMPDINGMDFIKGLAEPPMVVLRPLKKVLIFQVSESRIYELTL